MGGELWWGREGLGKEGWIRVRIGVTRRHIGGGLGQIFGTTGRCATGLLAAKALLTSYATCPALSSPPGSTQTCDSQRAGADLSRPIGDHDASEFV